MTILLSLSTRSGMLDGFEDAMEVGSGTATLVLYQTNLELCVFNLEAAPFLAAVSGALALDGVPKSNTGTAVAGSANRFVLEDQDGDETLRGTISGIGGGGDIETPSLTVTAAATQTLNALVIRMASNGALTVEASLTLV
jgi:hypothetical protein